MLVIDMLTLQCVPWDKMKEHNMHSVLCKIFHKVRVEWRGVVWRGCGAAAGEMDAPARYLQSRLAAIAGCLCVCVVGNVCG